MYQHLDTIYEELAQKGFGSLEDAIAFVRDRYAESVTKNLAVARFAFRWICDNIEYDVEGLIKKEYTRSVEEVIATKKALCGQFAELFQKLCIDCGMGTADIELVCGHAKGFMLAGEKLEADAPNHGWNRVKICGKWFIVDACWGAGFIDSCPIPHFVRRRNDDWFLADPECVIFTHFPRDPDQQMRPKPIDWHCWRKLPRVGFQFVRVGLCFVEGSPLPQWDMQTVRVGSGFSAIVRAKNEVELYTNFYFLGPTGAENHVIFDPEESHLCGEPSGAQSRTVRLFCKFSRPGVFHFILFAGWRAKKKLTQACVFKFVAE